MLSKETKDKIIEYSKNKGYGITDAEIMEGIADAHVVWKGSGDEHRWYTLIPSVVEVAGIYLRYERCSVKGEESSVEDCIGGYKLEDVIEVKPVVKPMTVYEPVE